MRNLKKIVICGYHGFQNSGDEALLWAMIEAIRKKRDDLQITVLSMRPESTKELYGVDSVYRYNLFKINKLFREADLFLFGGGSLLQDVTSSRSIYYYLTIIKLALKNKVKVMLYGNGIGPINKQKNRHLTRKILNHVDMITLRDDMSDKLLTEIGVNIPKTVITADPAFTLKFDLPHSHKLLLSELGFPKGEKYAVMALRNWSSAPTDFEETMAKICDRMYDKYGIHTVFIPMQPQNDIEIAKSILGKMKNKGYLSEKILSVKETFSLIGASQLAIGMRLHTLIYATTLCIPTIALSYDPKVEAFMQSIGQSLVVDIEKVSFGALSKMLDSLISDFDRTKDELSKKLDLLYDKAQENADYAINLLK